MAWRDWLALMDWKDWTEIVGVSLAIIAFITGFFHSRDIKRASERVRTVQESLSTRFLGTFPSFVKDIVDLVNSAETDILIQCDFPGYATLSDPVNALGYRYALERQRERGIKISLTCFDAVARKRYLSEQYPAGDWGTWAKAEPKRQLLHRFIRAYGDETVGEEVTLEQFFAANEAADSQLLKQVFDGCAQQTPLAMPIYFWIVDGKSAIFAIPTLTKVVEYGFKTSDPKLIQALTELRSRYAARPDVKAETV